MSERYQILKRALADALELAPEAREAFVAQRCGDDLAMRDELLELLRCSEDTSAFLRAEPELPGELSVLGAELGALPERIAGCRIVRKIGEGGMGTVLEAEQEKPERRVAIKLLRTGLGSSSSRRRFELEAEILARLEHPGIARIYAAGAETTSAGSQPYLVMELVRGRTLSRYAREAKPPLRERLRLLCELCEAVEHAHRKAVVHRDLKPQNVLVDDAGRCKVLDFGIARLLDEEREHAGLTLTGQIVGTLAYMSPEQAGGDPADVDTRSDVYALGVIAYQLVTGSLPLDLRGKTALEAAQIIRDVPPDDPRKLADSVPTDLAAVLLKAIEKDPNDRYAGAFAFAEDLRAVADGRPVRARSVSAAGRLMRWVRREPWKAAAGAVLLVACFGLTALTAYIVASAPTVAAGEAQLRRERVEAHLRRGFVLQQSGKRTEAAAEFDAGLALDPASTELRVGRCLVTPIDRAHAWLDERHSPGTAPRALDRVRAYLLEQAGDSAGAERIGRELGEARGVMDLIVAGWIELSRVPRTPAAMQLGVDFFARAQLRARVPSFLTLAVLAEVGAGIGDLERARDAAEALMELWPDEAYGPSAAAFVLGSQGRLDEAIELVRAALAREPRDAIVLRYRHAELLAQAGRDDESYAILEELCEQHPNDARAWTKISVLLAKRGEFERAIAACEKALALGDYAPFEARANLGLAYMMQGKLEEAEKQFLAVRAVVPGHGNMHQGLLQVAARRRDGEAMLREIERWIALRPGDAMRHVELARFYLESAQIGVAPDPNAALRAARAAVLASRGQNALALWTQARADAMLGNFARVREAAMRGLDLLGREPSAEPGLQGALRSLVRQARRATRGDK